MEVVETSKEICSSYLEKAENCHRSAKILLENDLYENSISMSYYAMYNCLTALLFRIGIKCENHSGSILLLKALFGREELFKIISEAKKERIDKQYYVTSIEGLEMTAESAEEMVESAEDFIVKMKLIIKNLNSEEIENFRVTFEDMF